MKKLDEPSKTYLINRALHLEDERIKIVNKQSKDRIFFIFSVIHIVFMIAIIVCSNQIFNALPINRVLFIALYYIGIVGIPVFVYLLLVDKVNPLKYLKITVNVVDGLVKGVAIIVVILIFLIALGRFSFKNINLHNQGILLLGMIGIGLFEEITFRGFYLRKLKTKMNFSLANITTAAIFTLMHVVNLEMGSQTMKVRILVFMLVGFLFGFVFEKTRSIWAVFLCHAMANFLMFVL